MRHCAGAARFHLQARLGAVEHLDLALFVDREDHRMSGRYGAFRPSAGSLWIAEDSGAALQADGETRSVITASSIRRRSAAWTILLDWTFRSRRRASALWMTQARSFGK